MKRHQVTFSPRADRDLDELIAHIAERTSDRVALAYVRRIRAFCDRLEYAPKRGSLRRDGSRTIGFEGRVTIRFQVGDGRVEIVTLAYGGRSVD